MKPSPINVCQQNLFEIEAVNQKSKQKDKPKNEESYAFDIVDALSAPILVFSHQWADIIPKRLLDIVQLARLKALLQREQLATYAECVIYIYARTLEAPMDSEWVDIYTHISCKTLQEWFGEDHWKDTMALKELNPWLHTKLNELRRHIYNNRRELLKTRLKNEEKIARKTQQDNEETDNTTQQPSLFPI